MCNENEGFIPLLPSSNLPTKVSSNSSTTCRHNVKKLRPEGHRTFRTYCQYPHSHRRCPPLIVKREGLTSDSGTQNCSFCWNLHCYCSLFQDLTNLLQKVTPQFSLIFPFHCPRSTRPQAALSPLAHLETGPGHRCSAFTSCATWSAKTGLQSYRSCHVAFKFALHYPCWTK